MEPVSNGATLGLAAAKAVYREFLYIIDDFEREKIGIFNILRFFIFYVFNWAFGPRRAWKMILSLGATF